MKRLTEKHYEEYHNNLETKDIGGTLDKKFLRIDSKFLSRYFDEISKPNSSYVSYADDLIREYYDPKFRDEYGEKSFPIKYLSALVKHTDSHNNPGGRLHEVYSSRFANLFGIPTVYNEQVRFNKREAIISLDFLKDGETMSSLLDLGSEIFPNVRSNALRFEYDEYTPMNKWCNLITDILNCNLDKNIPNRNEMISEICGDFCLQMLYKTLIVNDEDFSVHNVAIVFSKDKKSARLAPAHDFEYCILRSFSVMSYIEYTLRHFKFLNKHFPEKLAKFMDNFQNKFFSKDGTINSNRIEKIFKEAINDEATILFYYISLAENLKRFKFTYDKFIQNPEADIDTTNLYQEYMALSKENTK